MFPYSKNPRTNRLTLDEAVMRLSRQASVAGLAFFGARVAAQQDAVSDHDLLVLLDAPPITLFQSLTHIDGRMADIAFATVADAEHILANPRWKDWSLIQRLLMLKMAQARIVVDRSGLLARTQTLARAMAAAGALNAEADYASRYGVWFWGNFVLAQVKRMAQSSDPVYQTATDMLLLTALSSIARDYFVMRAVPWEGEKTAIRWLSTQDPAFLQTLRECMACAERAAKIALFERLFARVIAPEGEVWDAACTAVFLAQPTNSPDDVTAGLSFFEALTA